VLLPVVCAAVGTSRYFNFYMSKLVKGFFLNWHLALDTTITHYFAINLAQVGHFELAAAVSVGDSLLKLALALPGSIAASWTRPSVRVDWCVLFRATLVASWLTAISLLATSGPGVVVAAAFIIFKGIAIIDNALSADFQFFAKDALELDLSQTTSIQNIIARAPLAAAPAFALYLTENKFSVWHLAPMTVIFLCIGISTLRSIKNIAPSQEISKPSLRQGYRYAFNFKSIINSNLMRWGIDLSTNREFCLCGRHIPTDHKSKANGKCCVKWPKRAVLLILYLSDCRARCRRQSHSGKKAGFWRCRGRTERRCVRHWPRNRQSLCRMAAQGLWQRGNFAHRRDAARCDGHFIVYARAVAADRFACLLGLLGRSSWRRRAIQYSRPRCEGADVKGNSAGISGNLQ
jgi:hypothetical protein